MTVEKKEKLKNLMHHWPSGGVATSVWLHSQGVSDNLAKYYVSSGWLESVGHGAYQRAGDKISWYGALASLQVQTGMMAHIGGPTALELKGRAHYVRKNAGVFLFSQPKVQLPKWYRDYGWDTKLHLASTAFLEADLGITTFEYQGVELQIASPERAVLECLYLSPKHIDLVESYQLLSSLHDLRPDILQSLLEACTSIKVKRLFLCLAEKAKLPVLKHLKLGKIDLGKGPRSIITGGVFDSKYNINLPKELEGYAG